jgi:hypothetical protein
MRYYVLTPGSPGYIWAEWATPDRETVWAEGDPENRRNGLGGALPAESMTTPFAFGYSSRSNVNRTASPSARLKSNVHALG